MKFFNITVIVFSFMMGFFSSMTQGKSLPKLLKFQTANLAAEIKYQGKIVQGLKYQDQLGENIVILTETNPHVHRYDHRHLAPNHRGGYLAYAQDIDLYAYHFVKKGKNYDLLWKFQDSEKKCFANIAAKFFPFSLRITDLNQNGIAETSFVYFLQCRLQTGVDQVKLVMHEEKNRYFVQGPRHIYTEKNTQNANGQSYQVSPLLKQANPKFQNNALERWKKFHREHFLR